MGFNADLHSRLDEMARLLELTGANRFRVNAFARAARAVESQPRDLSTLEEKGLAGVLDIQGLGPKTVRLMWQDLGITDRASLKKAIDDGSILSLPRMGEKTVENIKTALTFASKSNERLALGIAAPIADALIDRMKAVKGVKQCAFAGSLRRGKDTIGDIDILVSTTNPEAAAEAFCEADNVKQVIARGETKCSVRLAVKSNSARWKSDGKLPPTVGADLRIVPEPGRQTRGCQNRGSRLYQAGHALYPPRNPRRRGRTRPQRDARAHRSRGHQE